MPLRQMFVAKPYHTASAGSSGTIRLAGHFGANVTDTLRHSEANHSAWRQEATRCAVGRGIDGPRNRGRGRGRVGNRPGVEVAKGWYATHAPGPQDLGHRYAASREGGNLGQAGSGGRGGLPHRSGSGDARGGRARGRRRQVPSCTHLGGGNGCSGTSVSTPVFRRVSSACSGTRLLASTFLVPAGMLSQERIPFRDLPHPPPYAAYVYTAKSRVVPGR